MPLIERIKEIIPPSVSKTIPDDYNFKIISNGNKVDGLYIIDKKNKLILLNIKHIPFPVQKRLKKAIKSEFDLDNVIFKEVNKLPLLEQLYAYNKSQDNQTLKFFEHILSKIDYETLRDSLFLRERFLKEENISSLKADITVRYGIRGNVISNLCTAGYFEATMIPLYNKDEKEFWKYWDIAVDKGIVALFVNSSMKIAKITDEIKRRLHSAKSCGQKYIHIHGIGDRNIKKINECLEKEKANMSFVQKNVFQDKKLHVIIVEIML